MKKGMKSLNLKKAKQEADTLFVKESKKLFSSIFSSPLKGGKIDGY
jgi:hypothetical protein